MRASMGLGPVQQKTGQMGGSTNEIGYNYASGSSTVEIVIMHTVRLPKILMHY